MKTIEKISEQAMSEKTRASIDLILKFQSERAGREFYEAVENEIRQANMRIIDPWFSEIDHKLTFRDKNGYESIILARAPNNWIASYIFEGHKLCGQCGIENIIVAGYPAKMLACKQEDILQEKINPKKFVPVMISIGNREYTLMNEEETFTHFWRRFS